MRTRDVRTWPDPGATWADAIASWPVVEAAMAGGGPAVSPVAGALPECEIRDDAALLIGTSGSTGTPKAAVLTAHALRASVDGVHDHLGGPGHWMLSVPPSHITGFQVLLRAATTGLPATPLPGGPFTPESFAAATASMPRGGRRYTTLVPTQLVRLLDDPVGLAAARTFDRILVGGAPLATATRLRAEREGLAVTTGYGASETGGGCVYDGAPLDCTAIRLDERDGRVEIGGATIAHGYAGRPDLAESFREEDGVRWFRTDDVGEWHGDRLALLGRADDIINTGGLKVAPRVVEEALATAFPQLADVLVVGVPDTEWGEIVAAALVVRPGGRAPDLAAARECVDLPAHARPRFVATVPMLPLTGPGKPDRAATREVLRRLRDASASSVPA